MTPAPSMTRRSGSRAIPRISSESWMRSLCEADVLRLEGPRARRDEHELAREPLLAVLARHDHRVRILEPPDAVYVRHPVPQQIGADPRRLRRGDHVLPRHQLFELRGAIELDRDPVELARLVPREINRRFAQRLARQGPRVHARPSRLGRSFDDRDLLAEVSRLRRRLLPRGSSPDDDQIESLDRSVGHHERIHCRAPLSRSRLISRALCREGPRVPASRGALARQRCPLPRRPQALRRGRRRGGASAAAAARGWAGRGAHEDRKAGRV